MALVRGGMEPVRERLAEALDVFKRLRAAKDVQRVECLLAETTAHA